MLPERDLLGRQTRLYCPVVCETKARTHGMTILLATFKMSSTLHLRVEARHLCTCLVNSSTVSFVKMEWDVLRVYVMELLLT